MRKVSNFKILAAVALMGAMFSCDNYNEDDDQTLNTRNDKPIVTLEQTTFNMTEGEAITINLTADKAISRPMEFILQVAPGSTGSYRDFVAGGDETTITTGAGTIAYLITMPAYTTTYSFDITPPLDLLVEGTETLNLRFYGSSNSEGIVAPQSEMITINLANGTSNDFHAYFEWAGEFADDFGTMQVETYAGVDEQEHEYCDFDFDIEIYDAEFNAIAVDYNNCPAEAVLSSEEPDGDYIVVATFYSDAIATGAVPASGDIIFPAILTMAKPGVWSHTVDLTGRFTYAAGGFFEGNSDALIPVAILTKTGTTYTLKDYDNPETVWAQGRMADLKNILASRKVKK